MNTSLPYRETYQAGLSLVELMVAMVLSLIVVAALTQLFVNLSASSKEMSKSNSQIENARFGMQYLHNDIVHAGYWGGYLPDYDDLSASTTVAPADEPTIVPDPCQAFTDWDVSTDPLFTDYRNAMLGIPVDVRNAMPAGCGSLTNKVANTDILIVRHANTCVAGDANCEDVVDGDLYLQVANCEAEVAAAPLVLDAVPVGWEAGDLPFTRTPRNCGTSPPSAVPPEPILAPIRKLIQTIYYVRDWTNEVGDGVPALVRSRLQFTDVGGVSKLQHQSPPEVLVEGIERLRVEVGIDSLSDTGAAVNYGEPIDWEDEGNLYTPTNRGDGIPDGNFAHCGAGCTAEQLRDVVAVKMYILSRANEATAGYEDTKDYTLGGLTVPASALADDFKRHVFSQTVRLNNISGRRETPPVPPPVGP